MDNILYYPYINLPPTEWSLRTLLYYESIGTIVPYNYIGNTNRYDPFMKRLITNELVVPISPMDSLQKPDQVIREFIYYTESSKFNIDRRRANFRGSKFSRIHKNKFTPDLSEIHSGKFDHELFYRLEHAGLAKRKLNGFYAVEKQTANELMTFIASVLGVRLNYLPTTDQLKRRPFKATGLKKKDYKIFKAQNQKREIVLEKLIPFPSQFDLKKLNQFKKENRSLLKKFKNKVEEIALDPNLKIDSEAFENRIDVLKDQKDELSARMNESKLVPRLISASGVVAALGGLQSESRLGQITGAIGLAGAIAQALTYERPKNISDQTGLKYLALAERTLTSKESFFSL